MSKILIFGKGFIAQRLKEPLKAIIIDRRINSYFDIEEEIKKHNPKIIINAIGVTGRRNVDDCELEFDKTITANTFVPILFAEAAFRHNVKLVHLSSGCIYHYDYKKQKPIEESLIPDYYDLYYSRSKIYAELILNEMAKRRNILIARVRIPLDVVSHPKNVLNKLIQYKTIIDIPNSVTYIPDFIKMIQHLIKVDARGIYNTVNEGGLRYSDLMSVYKKLVPDFEFTILPMKKFNLKRTNLVLSTKKLKSSGFAVRKVKDVLEECVKAYVKS